MFMNYDNEKRGENALLANGQISDEIFYHSIYKVVGLSYEAHDTEGPITCGEKRSGPKLWARKSLELGSLKPTLNGRDSLKATLNELVLELVPQCNPFHDILTSQIIIIRRRIKIKSVLVV